ncbi:MAG TPA: ABC transporter permease [Candidatus Ignatzschineria merdigallinarum]|uniref:ABC transporter permease n=1 Tax=Candidatus Ignatzschineria merdigallinarum TaxID=2838621 RepID=A0A9D1Q619_9GAMM|nr:ABC transporter permease [Candidatus Ignatzschineria merdigallinarum]
MNNIILSMKEEMDAMLSGRFIPYYKVAIILVFIVATIFSVLYRHGVIFEGKIAVIDLDASQSSTQLIQQIDTSSFIKISEVFNNPVDPVTLVAHDRNLGVLYIPKNFEKSLLKGDQSVSLGYFIDDSNEAQNSKTFASMSQIIPQFGAEVSINKVASLGMGDQASEAILSPITLGSRYMFNPSNNATNSLTTIFIYFVASLNFGLTVLMIIGRLKVTGMWNTVFERGPLALISRIIPYAFFYTVGLTVISAILIIFGLQRFEGNYFAYIPSIFMTGLGFGLCAFILGWKAPDPGAGASKMILLVPPGFILGGAKMTVGILPYWGFIFSYCFPLVWLYRFYRDFAIKGQSLFDMLPSYGAFIFYLTILSALVTFRYYRSEQAMRKNVSVKNNAVVS